MTIASNDTTELRHNLPLTRALFSTCPCAIIDLSCVGTRGHHRKFTHTYPSFIVISRTRTSIKARGNGRRHFRLLTNLTHSPRHQVVFLATAPRSNSRSTFNHLLSLVSPSFNAVGFRSTHCQRHLTQRFIRHREVSLISNS